MGTCQGNPNLMHDFGIIKLYKGGPKPGKKVFSVIFEF